MSTAAGRKKSIISGADNTVLNKAASQSTSLYQQCSALRTRLMRVQDFSDFFSLSSQPEGSSSRRSTDPVTQLWDLFSLGVPLCYLFNLLPGVQPLDVETANFDPTNDKTRKRGIAMFAMGLRQLEGCGTFTVTDLWDRASTDGFVKVRHRFATAGSRYSAFRRSSTSLQMSLIACLRKRSATSRPRPRPCSHPRTRATRCQLSCLLQGRKSTPDRRLSRSCYTRSASSYKT